ncbi:MAG: hypothetical protein KTR35_02795 [Gammaproteobacteria bacterium]|nr:hypothetical protein [Gammaproteobacteria bacterium]
MSAKLPLSIIAFLLTMAAAFVAWFISYRFALDDLNLEANQKLEQVVDQFRGQLSAARILPTLLARNDEIVESVIQNAISDVVKGNLERARDLSGAYDIRLLDSNGNQLFSTRNNDLHKSNANTYYFIKSMQGALGVEVRYNASSETRTLTFARSIIDNNLMQIGAVVLELELDTLETEFRARPEIIVFVDSSGTVVFTNRARLVSRKLTPYRSELKNYSPNYIPGAGSVVEQKINETKSGSNVIWHDFPDEQSRTPRLMTSQLLLPIGLEAILAIDTKSSRQHARKIAWLVLTLIILALVSSIALFQRRKYFIDRIKAEQALSQELDRRVAIRSKELEHAQNELVQSAKLSALGKMSIGISHELNQPISSIQNFSVNAKRFLEQSRIEDSLENLNEIEIQTERISRIIKNLRNFTSKDAVISEPIDINKVIGAVAHMLELRLREDEIVLSLDNIDQPIFVRGGEIRLQQVLINILVNAADAMKNQETKEIDVRVEKMEDMVNISIKDNGPGLSDPTRVFEPFYTTKTGSHDDGLGLGLSIAYGFVESFGGSLRATNCQDGGALFTLLLSAVEPSKQ